ncbi:RNA polymerase I-specific transcription-initiation factor-domain-containing protein [Russula compacta]|nr:RNA polymerase I-specific transcription-initiation factor-domain-containing protein [Russula compacta]
MRSPQLHPRTMSCSQRAEHGAHFLRTYYPDVDVPAELIREQVSVEAQLEDSLRAFDPLIGDLVTSLHVSDGSKMPWSFIAFPMGESGCDLNISSIEFSAEGNIITEPSHYPAKTFETPIRQIVSSSVSNDLSKETVVGVRTFSSTSLSSLSLPTSKQSKNAFIEIKEIDSINSSNLNGHTPADIQIHSSLEYAALVNDQGHVFRQTLLSGSNPVKVYESISGPANSSDGVWRIALGEHRETCFLMSSKSVQLIDFRAAERCVQVYSIARVPDFLTSMTCDPNDGLCRLVTTNELIWVDPRLHTRPILAWKHEREYDRTLSSHAVGIRASQSNLTVLSSRNNALLSVYDVSRNQGGLLQSHASPYSLPARFPSGPHAGFYVICPHPESGNATTTSLLQLSSRGGIYQTSLVVCQDKFEKQSPAPIDISWSPALRRLAATSHIQRPDVGQLGARAMQEVDFRQAYQRLFSPLDAAEAVYPAEDADTVYQTLDMMSLFWQEASTAHDHLLTTFDIAFRSGEEPKHASRADFLTQSALSSRRGFRALTQGRVPRDILIKRAAWYVNLVPVLQRFVPDISEDVLSTAERLRRYDLVVDDDRSGSSLRRESEAREQLAVDLVLSTDVFSAQTFAKAEAKMTEDDEFETMSRAAEAMTLSETELPLVHFGYLSPISTVDHDHHNSPNIPSTSLALPLGVRLLLSEWDTGTDPDQYSYHDPYDDQQTVATSLIPHAPTRKHGDHDGAQATQSQPIATAAPPVVVQSRAAPTTMISSSQPIIGRLEGRSLDATDYAGPDLHLDAYARIASSQVVPGPFGGRLPTGKKKASRKKTVGGF